MRLQILISTFLLTPMTALAQSGAPQELSFVQRLVTMMPMIVIIFGIFYFMVILPQRKQEGDHKKLIDSLKKGDRVSTVSGIIGRVSAVEDDVVQLEVAQNCKIKFEKASIKSKVDKKAA